MRLVFMGSPPFATPVFERLLASRQRVVALVTQPDRPSGRGRKIEPSPLALLAKEHTIEVLQPATTRDPLFVEALRRLAPDVLLVASYGEILRRDVLELAPHGALNVHASLLPRHRGASPIQAAILCGDRETGVSVQRMVQALDEGDVLLEERTPIAAHENAGELLERLAQLGAKAAVRALDRLETGAAHFTPQDPLRATYAKKIGKEQGRIDWTASAAAIERHVRAMTPWPGAQTRAPNGREVIVLDACEEFPESLASNDKIGSDVPLPAGIGAPTACVDPRPGEPSPSPGTIVALESKLFVATGRGLLEIRALKPASKSSMEGSAWLRGAHIEPGARFS